MVKNQEWYVEKRKYFYKLVVLFCDAECSYLHMKSSTKPVHRLALTYVT